MKALVALIFISLSAFAGDVVIYDKGKNIMTAIKTDDIGNTRVRVSAWMNAQHKSGLLSCRLAGSIKPHPRMKRVDFERRVGLLPGEFIPLHLGNFGRDFDPSESIIAKVNCEKHKLSVKTKTTKRTTAECCSLAGGISTVCSSTGDDDGVVVDLDLNKYNNLSRYPPCYPIGN